jgi:N-acetylglucosaminyldiphosphoundecaprenol N-acetyl-beta-D-mannosaminyltransferase
MKNIRFIDFFNLKLSTFDIPELLDYFKDTINNNGRSICYGYSFGTLPYFKDYPEIAVFSNQFDVSVIDGRGLYVLVKLLRFPVKLDLSIPNMVDLILKQANENSYSVMLLGAKEEINIQASANLKLLYPNANILPGINGYFKDNQESEVIYKINLLKPDILLIGISSPKKERFAFTNKNRIDVKIIIPCGGVIDILAGYKKRTPKLIKNMGLAWLYRFIQEPKRLFRDSIVNSFNVLFLLIPSLLYNAYISRKSFSIPKFYNKFCDAPIK